MPHLAERLKIKYSQKEKEFQQACAMKKRSLRLKQNEATDKKVDVSREASQHKEQEVNDPTDSPDKSSTAGFAMEYMLEFMTKEVLEESSDQVFKQLYESELIAWLQTQIQARKNYSSNLSCVGNANLNNAQTFAPYVIPSMVNAQVQNMILTRYFVMRYWQNLMNHQQKK